MIDDQSERDPVDVLAEEFLDRRRRHETPTPEEYARQYPALAERIRSVFPALMMLDDFAPEIAPRPAETPRQLGEFRIIRQLGRGGMGVVYEAVQQSLERRVALKVLPAESARDPVYLERFRSEARTAAMLHHTHIVAVHGAGSAEGVHFLVMQLIDGVGVETVLEAIRLQGVACPSAETKEVAAADTPPAIPVRGEPAPADLPQLYAESRSGYYRAVARLTADAADALAHAHQQGVVHRDVKPSNLLLARDGTIYVSDFGLAKAEGAADLTRTGWVVGTPRYLAPERFDGKEGPGGDVFALGATLYELLTTKPAFEAPSREQLIERVKHAEPVRPRSLAPGIPRDLETIALSALAKEPGRRPSAGALAEDLRRWLDGRPIKARRVGPVERLVIWAKRNPVVATLTASLFVALTGGLGVALGFWRTSEGHRVQAVANAETADRRLDHIEKVNRILIAVFRDINPRGTPTDDNNLRATIGRRLEDAARQIETADIGDLRTVSTIQDSLGVTLTNLGQYEQAIAVLRRAVKSGEQLDGPDHVDTLTSRANLATALAGTANLDESIAILEDVLRRRESLLGADHPVTMVTKSNLATVYNKAGRNREAVALHEQLLSRREALLGPVHADTIVSRNNLATALSSMGQAARALRLHEENYAACKAQLGPNHLNTMSSRGNVAAVYLNTGRIVEAKALFEENLAARLSALGPDHPDTLLSQSQLADALRGTKRFEEAVQLHEQVFKARTRILGPLHPATLHSRANLGRAYREVKRMTDAVAMHEEAYRLRTLVLGEEHADTLVSGNDLAISYRQAGRPADAIRLHVEIFDRRTESLGVDHPSTQSSAGNLANAYIADKRPADAERVLRGLVDSRQRTLKRDDKVLTDTRNNLARVLLMQGKFAEAEPIYRDLFDLRSTNDQFGWLTADSRGRLGEALLGQRRFEEAEPHLLGAHEVMARVAANATDEHRARVKYTVRQIVKLYEQWGKTDQASIWRDKLGD